MSSCGNPETLKDGVSVAAAAQKSGAVLERSESERGRRGGRQRRHGARLKVNVHHGARDVAAAAPAGRGRADLALLQTLDVTLEHTAANRQSHQNHTL